MRNIYTLVAVATLLSLTASAQKNRGNRSDDKVEVREQRDQKPSRTLMPTLHNNQVREDKMPVRQPQEREPQQVGPVRNNGGNGNSGNNGHQNNGNAGNNGNFNNSGNGHNQNHGNNGWGNNNNHSNNSSNNGVRNPQPNNNNNSGVRNSNGWSTRNNERVERNERGDRDDRNFRDNDRRIDYANRYGNNGGRYNRYDRNYYPDYRRPFTFVGVRYTNFYRPHISIVFSNRNYYYSDGFFYQPFGTSYQVIIAPIGIRVNALPWGYRRWYIGPSLYYYYGGTYYRRINNYYEVTDAPIGSILPEVPDAAKAVVINSSKYYELNGTYYKETIRNGEVWYTIVGKNGVLNTQYDNIREDDNSIIGDVVTELPSGYKTVVLNNHKYYVTETGTYYDEFISDNTIFYKVIAKPQ